MRETSKKVLFWALMFFGAFLLLTQVGYSDGDDAFFYQYTHEMGFFEYLSWRYPVSYTHLTLPTKLEV